MADAEVREAPYVYPVDPRDGWEPGAPSVKAMGPSTIAGVIIPITVFFSVRHAIGSDAPALAIAGIPAAAWVAIEWFRKRRIDPLAMIVLLSFVAGISVSAALGGNAFVLKVRDSGFTVVFGLTCLVSLRFGSRPMMFIIGRAMSAGEDTVRLRLFDDLWEIPPARVVFRIVTLVWGVGLISEGVLRVVLAKALPTGVFVILNPIVAAMFVGTMFGFTVWFTRWSRSQSDTAFTLDVPADGGSMLWWARYYRSVWLAGHRTVAETSEA
jgi:hypothetical protein